VEVLAVGVYVEAYEATGGAVYDSREVDFGSQKPKEARELELDIETTGTITATLYSDLPGFTMSQVFQGTASSTGRQQIKLPLTQNAVSSLYPIGRSFRLILSGTNAFRLYGAKLKLREFGTYLTSDEAGGGGVWDSTPLDMGVQHMKAFKRIELELQTDGTSSNTLQVLTDQSGLQTVVDYTKTVTTNGVREVQVFNFTPGMRGRLLQVILSGNGVRLFAGRIWWRPLNAPQAKWDWAPLPIAPTAPQWADAPFPVNPTEAQWFWAKVLSVEDTPDTWSWIDLPFTAQ
jgi:hypothetical protein